jgi:hypothetical protein
MSPDILICEFEVGRAMRDPRHAELTIAALPMAIQRRRPAAGLIYHSDSKWIGVRGNQDAAGDDRKILHASANIQSMSRKANG